jgi:TRAP-type C4-dicarboxylate transport system substrate-binding protein
MTRLDSPRRLAAVTLAALAGLAGSTQLAAAQSASTELRMATLAPSGSRWEKTLTEGASQIAKATDSRVTVKYYPDAGQGDEKDYIRKINQGQLDGAAVTSVGLSMVDPAIKVLELPRMYESEEELDYVRGKMWKYFQKKFEDKGYVLGEEGDVGWVYFLSKNKVDSLKSLKDQKVWRWNDDKVVEAMFNTLGLSGVPLGVPEVDSSLSSGSITACYGPPLAAMTLGWATKVKYMTSMAMSYSIGATVIRKTAFDKVSKDDQKALRKVTKAISKKLRKNVRKDNKAAEKEMKRKGVTIVTIDPAMIAEFDTAAEKVWKSLVGKLYSQDELDMVLKYRAEYRAKKGK